MKTKIFPVMFCLAMAVPAWAQVPQMFNYQAVVRDAQHAVIANQPVGFRLSILEGSAEGPAVYTEIHSVVTTAAGLAELEVGEGAVVQGDFSAIPWGEQAYFLKIELDPAGGSSYGHVGTSRLISVPYSLYSANVASPTRKFVVQEESGHPADSALFEVRNRDGQTVFAVYPEGTRVYVLDDDSKATRRGFAVGGYSRGATKGVTQEYMHVSPDSVRIYISDEPAKGVKGGFAVGGYSKRTKAGPSDYMSVFRDSIRFFVGYQPGKGSPGGFAIRGRNTEDGQPITYLFLTPRNYFIGELSGNNNTTGKFNTFIGYRAGESNTEGDENVVLGYLAGNRNTTGNKNVFIGDSAGFHNNDGNYNVFMGRSCGLMNETGNHNVFIGAHAGEMNVSGNRNLFLGTSTGKYNIEGQRNCFLGQFAGYYNNDSDNTFVGNYAGSFHEEGIDNVFMGNGAGYRNYAGSGNVFVGKWAGYYSDSAEFNVAIGNLAGGDLRKGEMNVLIGHYAGSSILETSHNTFLGAHAGRRTETGSWNTFIGNNSGFSNVNGQDNTYIGSDAGLSNVDGTGNVFIGISAGENNPGHDNVFIGSWSGANSAGSGNVFIGNWAGRTETGSNILLIDTDSESDETSSLIYGRFDENNLRMNAYLGIGTAPDPAFSIRSAGDINANNITLVSDARFKTGIENIPEALELVMALEGVKYRWNRDLYPEREFDAGLHYGFLAQELEEVVPELVITGNDGYKSVNYEKVSTLLVEAIKSQQGMIEERDTKIQELEQRLEYIESLVGAR